MISPRAPHTPAPLLNIKPLAPISEKSRIPRTERPIKAAPLVAQGSRPVRSGRVTDYKTQVLGEKRRGTAPVPRRNRDRAEEEEEERQHVVIGRGKQQKAYKQGVPSIL